MFLTAQAIVLEVATFKAQEVQTEWTQLVDNPNLSRAEFIHVMLEDDMSAEEISHLKQHLLTGNNIWHTYKKQYAYKPLVVGQSPFNMWVTAFNGEDEFFNLSKPMS